MPVLPFAHSALYLFCNLPLFQVFLENPFLIILPFCTILCQSYILLPFLKGFYTPLCLYNSYEICTNKQTIHLSFTPSTVPPGLIAPLLLLTVQWTKDVRRASPSIWVRQPFFLFLIFCICTVKPLLKDTSEMQKPP